MGFLHTLVSIFGLESWVRKVQMHVCEKHVRVFRLVAATWPISWGKNRDFVCAEIAHSASRIGIRPSRGARNSAKRNSRIQCRTFVHQARRFWVQSISTRNLGCCIASESWIASILPTWFVLLCDLFWASQHIVDLKPLIGSRPRRV